MNKEAIMKIYVLDDYGKSKELRSGSFIKGSCCVVAGIFIGLSIMSLHTLYGLISSYEKNHYQQLAANESDFVSEAQEDFIKWQQEADGVMVFSDHSSDDMSQKKDTRQIWVDALYGYDQNGQKKVGGKK